MCLQFKHCKSELGKQGKITLLQVRVPRVNKSSKCLWRWRRSSRPQYRHWAKSHLTPRLCKVCYWSESSEPDPDLFRAPHTQTHPHTYSHPHPKGRMLDNVASVLQSGLITDEVASTALSAATTMIGDMQAASSSGHVQEVVQAVANVFRGVARHSSSPSSEHARDMKLNLRNHAGNFCDKLTSNSAPDAAALGSASSDFLFSCQKVESAPTDGSGQVCCCYSCIFSFLADVQRGRVQAQQIIEGWFRLS